MNAIEHEVIAVLHAQESEVDVDAVLVGAIRRGHTLRRRRRLLRSAAAFAGVVGVAGGVVWAAGIGTGAGGAGPGNSADPAASSTSAGPLPARQNALPRPPAAPGEPLVTDQPGRLGNGFFHVDLDAPIAATAVDWSSGNDRESVDIFGADDKLHVTIQVARQEAHLTDTDGPATATRPVQVHNLPATLTVRSAWYAVRWQPTANLWAQVTGYADEQVALRAASGLSFDRAYRCASPFRLVPPPQDARMSLCTMTLGAKTGPPAGRGAVVLRIADSWISFSADPPVAPGSLPGMNTRINGREAAIIESAADGHRVYVSIAFPDRVAYLQTGPGYDRARALRIAESYQPVTDPDPGQWPTSPLS